MDTTDVVRACFAAYRSQDRPRMEQLLADDLTFTSPQDDRIDRAAYFERCFPDPGRAVRQDLLAVAADGPERVFVLYEYELKDGAGTWRNAEVHTVRDGRVHEIQVFFGGRY